MSSRLRSRRYRARRRSFQNLVGRSSRSTTFSSSARPVRWGVGFSWLGVVVAAVVLQTAVVGRIQIGGVSPDVVIVALSYAAFRLRDNTVLLLGFLAGVLLDVSGTSVIGLWSFAMTLVAWGASITREQGGRGLGANAVRILALTLAGVLAHTLVSMVFGEWSLEIWEALRRVALIPVLNCVLAAALFPVSSRLWVPSLK